MQSLRLVSILSFANRMPQDRGDLPYDTVCPLTNNVLNIILIGDVERYLSRAARRRSWLAGHVGDKLNLSG